MPDLPWDAVQQALDARRDPFDEPVVIEHLVDHPEDLAPLLDLAARLRLLGDRSLSVAALPMDVRGYASDRPRAAPQPLSAGPRSGRTALLGLLVAAVLLLATWRFATEGDARGPLPTARGVPAPSPATPNGAPTWAAPDAPPRLRGRVLEWQVETLWRGPSGTTRHCLGPQGARHERLPASPSDGLVLSWSDSWTHITAAPTR